MSTPPAQPEDHTGMNGPTLAVVIVLIAVLVVLTSLIVLQWILMKREQRRIEDLIELRTRQGSRAAAVAAPGGIGGQEASESKERV